MLLAVVSYMCQSLAKNVLQIFTDRFYTATHQNFAMFGRRTYFCGTLRREQRSHLPTEIMMGTRRVPAPAVVKGMQRGQTLTMHSNYGESLLVTQ